MEKPKRLYFYRGKVFFNYCIQYLERFRYDEDDTKIQYHGYDEHAIGFGLSNKWFGLGWIMIGLTDIHLTVSRYFISYFSIHIHFKQK
jgi:hypothetical protein